MRILHLSCVRALTAGQRKQLGYEASAAKRLQDVTWDTLAYHTGVPVESFERRLPWAFRIIPFRQLFAWLVILRHSRDYDFVLCRHMGFDPFALVFSWFVKNRVTIHHSKEIHELQLIRPGLIGRLATWMETLTGSVAVNNAVAVLGVTEDIREHQVASRRYAGRSSTYPNGIVSSDVVTASDSRRAGEVHAVFICGTFAAWHGLDLLLLAARDFVQPDGISDFKVHLIGKLSSVQLAEIAKANRRAEIFVVHGTLAASDYYSIVSSCDVGIGSIAVSRKQLWEAATLKVRELLAMGLPVISGHPDTALAPEFPFYRQPGVSFHDVIEFALAMKGVTRQEVREAASPFIDKATIMQSVVQWLAGDGVEPLPPQRSRRPERIVIVSYNWPPRNAIGSHRPYSWAKYWSAMGRRVTVLTARKYDIDQPLDLVLPQLDGVSVIEVPYLSTASAPGKPGWRANARALVRPFLRGTKSLLARRLGVRVDVRDRWIAAAASVAAKLASETDVVVSTFGPRSSHLIASEMKRNHPGIRWIADYRDLWSQNHLSDLPGWVLARERERELASVGRYADAVTTVSRELADELKGLLRLEVGVVKNGFDLSEEQLRSNLSRRLTRPARRPLRIVYTGMIYPGRRDPTPLFEAVKRLEASGELSPSDLSIDFYGSRNDGVDQLARRMGVESFVKIHGHVPREQALEAQGNADLALLLESGAPDAKGVLTGKLFEYLGAGTPVLSLGSAADSAIAGVLEYCGSGVCAGNDVSRVEDVLREMLGDTGFRWFHPVPERILEYSRENVAKSMLATYLDAMQ